MRSRRGAVVLSMTALESSGEVWISCTVVCARESFRSKSGSLVSSDEAYGNDGGRVNDGPVVDMGASRFGDDLLWGWGRSRGR